MTDMRPSGSVRIVKGTFECTAFLTALSYGFNLQGFGLHSYYLQTVGKMNHLGPWYRTKTLVTFFGQYLALTLPFFCTYVVIKI